MPIKFRCRHCRQFLGISRAQAGEITNCPQCGKAIRVPGLDGSVAPIPTPKLNYKDAQLADALSELSQLEPRDELQQTREETFAPHAAHSKDVASLRSPVDVPAPVATIIAAPIASRAAIVDTAQGTSVQEATHDALRSLAETASAPEPLTLPPRPLGQFWKWAVPVAGVLALFAAGWFLRGGVHSNSISSPAEEESTAAMSGADIAPTVAQPAVDDHPPALTGRITYISDTGDTRPDSGAVVLLLPRPRTGQIKLDVVGFLTGADNIDAEAAAAALHVLGGDVTTADDDGNYQLTVTSAGEYQFLVISHHKLRGANQSVDPQLQEALSDYFFHPSSLLGQLAFHVDKFHDLGQGSASQDISFATE